MKTIAELLKERMDNEPPLRIISKKQVISFIAQLVKFDSDPLKNWKIVAKRLSSTSPLTATKIYLSTKRGMYNDSKDYKGAFKAVCKDLPKVKKPKQSKLF